MKVKEIMTSDAKVCELNAGRLNVELHYEEPGRFRLLLLRPCLCFEAAHQLSLLI